MRDIEAKSNVGRRRQRLHFLDNVLEPLVSSLGFDSTKFYKSVTEKFTMSDVDQHVELVKIDISKYLTQDLYGQR